MEKVEFEETGGALPPPPPLLAPHGRPERLTDPPKRVAISRTGTGRSGRHINLVANHFKVAVNVPDAVFFQYSVLIKSEDNQEVVEGIGIGRKVVDKLYHTYYSELAGKNFACDGEKALYTVGSLPQKKFEFAVVLEEAAVKRGSPDLTGMETDRKRTKGFFRSNTFSVEISFGARILLKPIARALKGLEAENTNDALRVINIILGQQGAKRRCLVRPSFFHDDVRNFVNVDGGLTAFRGFHSSFRTTQGGLSLNMDISAYLPCLDVGKLKRPNYLPLELCSLISLERYTKALSNMQRASLVERSRQKPQERIRNVTDVMAFKNYRYDDDPMLKACGISIEKQLTAFEGRVLNAPTLKMGISEDCVSQMDDGTLIIRLFSLIQIKRRAVVNLFARCDMSYLSQELIKCGRSKGIHIDNPHSIIEDDSQWRRSGLVVMVEKLFEQVKAKLLGPWKKKNLHEMGIFTQRLSPTKVNGQYLTNVLLKINSKLEGMNSLLEVERIPTPPRLKETPTMILGMDVSHGLLVVRTQSPKVEMIDSLFKLLPNGEDDGIIRELLVELYKSSQGRKSEQIIIFRLSEECFQRRWYHTAACYILVIAKLEGPAVSQYCALRLLQATLDKALYELAGELVRFLLRSRREYDNPNTDSDKVSPRFLGYFLFRSSNKRQSFDSKSASFKEQSAHVTSVKNVLESHASYLMKGKELSKLVAFVKGTQFDLVEYLQRERSGSARLESFASGLKLIGQKLQMDTLQSRLDAEFLLSHMSQMEEQLPSIRSLVCSILSDKFGKHGLVKEKPARSLGTVSNPFQMVAFRHFYNTAAPESEAIGRWQLKALNNLGLGLPIVTIDGQLLDQKKCANFATAGYVQDGRTLVLWFLGHIHVDHKPGDTPEICQLYSEIVAIVQGAETAKWLGISSYWMRSDSKIGISYVRRAFSRYVRSNNLDFAVQPLQPKFQRPVRHMLGNCRGAFPRMIRIPGCMNLLANCLVRNAPNLLNGKMEVYRSFWPPLPPIAQQKWFDTE